MVIIIGLIVFAGCVDATQCIGIVSDVKCTKSTFCSFENLETRYIDVSFEITIDNANYVGKELKIQALTETEKVLHTESCTFGDSMKVTISYKEYSDAFQVDAGLANTKLQTKRIVIYDGDTVVGSAKIKAIHVTLFGPVVFNPF